MTRLENIFHFMSFLSRHNAVSTLRKYYLEKAGGLGGMVGPQLLARHLPFVDYHDYRICIPGGRFDVFLIFLGIP